MFINRETEIRALEEMYSSARAEFMVLYGRRRVGKTQLIDHFISGRRGIRLLGRLESEKKQLEKFSQDLADYFNDEFLRSNPFSNWDAFFLYINEKAKEKVVIALDEFPYLIDSNPALPSILQDHWDRYLKNSNVLLVLCGSSIAMMTEKVLGYKSPLYGRRTGQIKLEPMDFFESAKFHNFDTTSQVYLYSMLGGTPGYLMEFDDSLDIEQNIVKSFLRKDKFLFQDAEFVLREELSEPKYYFSILRAVAIGKSKMSEIINETGLSKAIVGKYLSVLADLDIIERRVPATEKHPHKSRKGLYKLKDNFYKFWFSFIFPNIEEIEKGKGEELASKRIIPSLNRYASSIFEDICKQFLWKTTDYEKIGSWWHKEKEIDIVALKNEEILFGECKWKDGVDAEKVLMDLMEKSKSVTCSKRKYAIFAKSFKSKKIKNALLFDLKDIIGFDQT